ncbi:MAG TPA: preprotein translocase subunit YajC [Verrucomicrobiales bacterium]|jgi:preprotein translocase subunit YajC|nr:preprotein translocase subunit YajC [Verrucomicrobiales bacterium]
MDNPVFFLMMMMFIFYFLLIRPQQKQIKEHGELVKKLETGDKVVTNDGIVGVITEISDREIVVRSGDTKLKIIRDSVAEKLNKAAKPSR